MIFASGFGTWCSVPIFRDECHASNTELRIRRINPPLHHAPKPKAKTDADSVGFEPTT
jgi:hypothetical protein